MSGSQGGHSLEPFLDALQAPAPSPCGGTAAAAAAAMAASLVVMVGRGSKNWADGPGVAAQAGTFRSRLVALGAEDAEAFGQVIATMRNPAGTKEQRNHAIGQALLGAAAVPLRIAEVAADVAELAALTCTEGAAHMRPDAAVAATLAEAAARGAAHLVEINLATVAGDELSERAEQLRVAAAAARERALTAF
jgi:methenyltetrahydrofolate cyclohydrolase